MKLKSGGSRFTHEQRVGILSILVLALIMGSGTLVAWALGAGKGDAIQQQPGKGLATTPQYLFSIKGDPQSGLLQPLAVTVAPDGDIYIADSGHAVVQVTDPDGKYKRTIGPNLPSQAGAQSLVYPVSVAVDSRGYVFVSDASAGHIYMTDKEGGFAGYFGETEEGKKFDVPVGLSIVQDRLYLNDIGRHKVLVFNMAGELIREVGIGKGIDRGQFNFANFSWVDPYGDIYVADSNNSRVQVFDKDGKIKLAFLSPESSLLRGVAVDDLGRILVADILAHQINVFDRNGLPLLTYGKPGAGEGQFAFPNGIWVSGKRVYIADRENNRVQVWEIS